MLYIVYISLSLSVCMPVSEWRYVDVLIIIRNIEFADYSYDTILCKYVLTLGYEEMRHKYDRY